MKENMKIDQNTYSVSTLVDMYNTGSIKIPPYQRRYQYNNEQKNNLITAILVGLPIDIPLCLKDKGSLILCDGMHRLVTISSFIKDGFPYKAFIGTAQKYGIDKEYNNKVFSDLPQEAQYKILNSKIVVATVSVLGELDSVDSLILNLMQSKNSSALPISKARMALNEIMSKSEGVIDAWSLLNKEFTIPSLSDIRLAKVMSRSNIANTFKLLSSLSDNSEIMVNMVHRFLANWTSDEAYNDSQLSSWIQGFLIKSYLEEQSNRTIDWSMFRDIFTFFKRYSTSVTGVSESNLYKVMAFLYGIPPYKNCKVTAVMIKLFKAIYEKPFVPDELKKNIYNYIM